MYFTVPTLIVRFDLADHNKVVEAAHRLQSAGLQFTYDSPATLGKLWRIEPPADRRRSPVREIKFAPDGAGALKMSITVELVFPAEKLEHVDRVFALLGEIGMHFGTRGQGGEARTWTWKDKMGPARLEIDPKSFTVEKEPDSGPGGIITRRLVHGD